MGHLTKREANQVLMEYIFKLEEARNKCTPVEQSFALNMAAGMSIEAAYCDATGQNISDKARGTMRRGGETMLKGNAGAYLGLLLAPMHEELRQTYTIQRKERMALLSEASIKCMMEFDKSKNTAHLGRMAKLVNELNKMDGQHAAQELNVKGVILNASIQAEMSPSQATDLYKRMMGGAKLEGVEHTEAQQISGVPAVVNTNVPRETESE